MKPLYLLISFCCFALAGCNAFMHGYTQRDALNKYNRVTGDPHNFGDKRIKYTAGFYHHSPYSSFLQQYGKPQFIFEYVTANKCRGIQLFYSARDSVFVFEQMKRNNLKPGLVEARTLNDVERKLLAEAGNVNR